MIKHILKVMIISTFFISSAFANDTTIVNTIESSTESYNEFVIKVAKFVNEWTAKNGVEICGAFTQNKNNTYTVILSTNKSQLSCNINYITNNEELTGDYIHSHPKVDNLGRIRVTSATRKKDGDFVENKEYIKISNHSFSPMDYNNGNGYLVVENKLYYQNGPNTQRFITNI